MKIATLLKSSTALSMVALLALSACGGGGGDGPTTTGGGGAAAAPVDGDGMMPADGDGDGMATEFEDGLVAGPGTSPVATSDDDSFENVIGMKLTPLSSPTKFENVMGNQGFVLHEEDDVAYVESISYGGQNRWTLIYVIDDQTTEVQFRSEQNYIDGSWRRDVDGTRFWVWDGRVYLGDSWQQEIVTNKYFTLFGWQVGDSSVGDSSRGYAAAGVVTPPENLSSLGSATYKGYMIADTWHNFAGGNVFDNRGQLRGVLTLDAEFSGTTSVTGKVTGIQTEPIGQSFRGPWGEKPESNTFEIENGTITENRFQAEWRGQDTATSAVSINNFNGFEGSMLGEFYGPDGDEVGGVFIGQREETNHVINGRFGAAR